MIYNVKTTDVFERQAKRLMKKYISLKKEIFDLIQMLKENPQAGTAIGNSSYKIRLAIGSKGKGKSGGARVITNFILSKETVYLLSIYDKSEKDNLTVKELNELLKLLPA